MRKVVETGRKYNYFDCFRIPLACAPISAGLIMINDIIEALIPSIRALLMAEFIDTALAIFHGADRQNHLYFVLGMIMLTILYAELKHRIMSYVNLCAELSIAGVFRTQTMEKRARLEYRYIEDNETWNLIERCCGANVSVD